MDAAAPTNVDSMAAAVSSMLATFGVTLTAAGLEGIRHWRSFNKTIVLEAVAALMPFLWLKIIEELVVVVRAAQRINASIATRVAGKKQKPDPAAPEKAPKWRMPSPSRSDRASRRSSRASASTTLRPVIPPGPPQRRRLSSTGELGATRTM
jgi:hypothetical protein